MNDTIGFWESGQFFIVIIIVTIALAIITGIREIIRHTIEKREYIELCNELDDLAEGALTLTVADFFALKDEVSKTLTNNNSINMTGVYILHNERDDLYYVGQATRLAQRVSMHFLGRGNGDVYADYKYGADFSIKMIPLNTTEFDTLNELERFYISHYDAYENGYNRTRGNRG